MSENLENKNILQAPPEFVKENEITYKREGDYYFPQLELPKSEMEASPIQRFGRMRKAYLKEKQGGMFQYLKLTGKLQAHLAEIDAKAEQLLEDLTKQMAEAEGVNEELKASNQMEWVGRTNNIELRAMEIVKVELICV